VKSLALPDSTFALLDSCLALPDSTFALLDSCLALPDSTLALVDSTFALPDSSLALVDSCLTLPGSTLALVDSTFALPDSSLALVDSCLTLPDSTFALIGSCLALILPQIIIKAPVVSANVAGLPILSSLFTFWINRLAFDPATHWQGQLSPYPLSIRVTEIWLITSTRTGNRNQIKSNNSSK
jgi:hypothetical protein